MVPTPSRPASSSTRSALLALGGIAIAGIAAYHNSFSGPFVFDDTDSIVNNASIRHLSTALISPPDVANTASGRPVLNFSLAISYALSRNAVWAYHALNVAIHILAGLALFGLVRRTLARGRLGEKATAFAIPVAFTTALLWTVHPLQSEAVTYIVQRAESLMGLFYLLTVYTLVRGAEAQESKRRGETLLWYSLSFLSCLCGVGTKEVMVTAPLIALLYDRVFISDSYRAALRARGILYLFYGLTWLALGGLIASTGGNRGGSIGFGIGISPFAYLLTQAKAIVTYLKLSFWPNPLSFDYGTLWLSFAQALPYALPVVLLLGTTAWALFSASPRASRPLVRAAGFAGAWFFLILAPTSSIVPGTTQMIVEHRMYLPLAAVIATVVMVALEYLGPKALWILAILALPLGVRTAVRNEDYQSELALWKNTATGHPENVHAELNFGVALLNQGRATEAIEHFQQTLAKQPTSVEALTDIGNALHVLGRPEEALREYEEALQLKPDYLNARIDLANLLVELHRIPEAVIQYEEVVRAKPDDAAAHNNLGMALAAEGDRTGALSQFQSTIRLNPDFSQAHYNLGNSLRSTGDLAGAVSEYEEAIKLNPSYAEAAMNLGNLLMEEGKLDEAVSRLQETIRLHPDFPDAHNSLGVAFMRLRRLPEAGREFTETIRLNPNYAPAHANLASVLHQMGHDDEANRELLISQELRSAPRPN